VSVRGSLCAPLLLVVVCGAGPALAASPRVAALDFTTAAAPAAIGMNGMQVAAFNAGEFFVATAATSSSGAATIFMGSTCSGDAGVIRFANGQSAVPVSVRGVEAGGVSFEASGAHANDLFGGWIEVLLSDGGQCLSSGWSCTSTNECCSKICMPDGMGGFTCV
jgi:hypothetical protein